MGHASHVCFAAVLVVAGIAAASSAQTIAIWNSPGDGLYLTPSNWDINRVPNNSLLETFDLLIAANGNRPEIRLDSNVAVTVDSLIMEPLTELYVEGRSDFTVLGAYDILNTDITAFGFGSTITLPSTSANIDNVEFLASNRGRITVGATTYIKTESFTRAFHAFGLNAVLEAPNLISIEDQSGSSGIQLVVLADEPGAIIRMPALVATSSENVFFQATDGGAIELDTFPGGPVVFSVDDASRIVATSLVTLEDGTLSVTGTGAFDAPIISAIDGAYFEAVDGAKLTLAATVAASTPNNQFSLLARGFLSGSATDRATIAAPSLQSLSGNGRLVAERGGEVSLLALTALTGDPTGWTVLARDGGRMDLSAATIVDNVDLIAITGAALHVAGVSTPPGNAFEISGLAELHATGSVLISRSQPNISDARFVFTGPGCRQFEAVHADQGVAPSAMGNIINRLTLGTPTQPTELELTDVYLNAGNGTEALYIDGDGQPGLVLEGGSTLYLNGVNAYLTDGGTTTSLASLIPNGAGCVSFGDGQVCLNKCRADTNGDGILDNGDIITFVALFLAGDPAADINGDGILDNGDIITFVAAFLAGC